MTQYIYVLRKALGNSGYIETIPRRGYRFTAPVKQWGEEDADLVVHEQSRTSIILEEQYEATETPAERPWLAPARSRLRSVPASLAIAVTFILAASLLAAAYYVRRPEDLQRGVTPVRSLAVLPLRPIGESGGHEYLGLGLADALITKMSRLRRTVVRPTSAVRKYADPQVTAEKAGRELGVDAVLEGTVQLSGDRVRVNIQLVRVAGAASIWADQFDVPLNNVFSLEDSITAHVTQILSLQLSTDDRRLLAGRPTTNADAYNFYLQGRYFWNRRTEAGVTKALEYFQKAIQLDPLFAQAYVGLADCHLFGIPRLPAKALGAKAKAMAQKALAIDDDLPEAHATLGLIAENFDLDWAEAEREYRRAIELNPNFATAHHWYGEYLSLLGRFDEAIVELRLAGDLDPLSVAILKDIGRAYYCARHYDLAEKFLRQALEIDPRSLGAQTDLGLVYAQTGQFSAAIAELQKAKQLEDGPEVWTEIGYVQAISGNRREAERTLGALHALSKRRYVSPLAWAYVYAGLREKSKALDWLEKSFREGALLTGLKVDPHFDSLRDEPRFADLQKRVGLASDSL